MIGLAWVVFGVIGMSHRYAGSSLKEKSFARSLLVVLHVAVVQFLVSQMRTDYQRDGIYMFFAWLMFGLIAAAVQIVQRERHRAEELEDDLPVRISRAPRVPVRPVRAV